MNPLEPLYIRDLAEVIKTMNVRMTWNYESGGWQVSFEDIISECKITSYSNDILEALEGCISKTREVRKGLHEHPTIRAPKRA